MARPLYTNNAATYLAFGITNTATTMQVSANAGSLFPNPTGGDYFYVSLISLSGPIIEIVKCTARSGDIFTIERGQEGTSALYWNMGDNVQLRITAAGMNYIAGSTVSTTLKQSFTATQGQTVFTLTNFDYAPGTNNLAVFVNGSKQVSGTNYTETNVNTVTFTTGLNLGDVVEFLSNLSVAAGTIYATDINYNEGATGAVTRTLESKLQESVSVLDFGAVGDGITNDTVAVQTALNSGVGCIYFPQGTYLLGQLTVPNSVKQIIGSGVGSSFLTCTGTFVNYTPWIYFDSIIGIEVSGLTINQDITTYRLNHALNFGSCQVANIHDLSFNSAGFFAIYMAGCVNCKVENIVIYTYSNTAIGVEAGSYRIRINGCTLLSAGTGHGIAVATGSDNEISDNYVFRASATNFCIAIGSDNSIVSRNRLVTNKLEGINLQDASRVSIVDNIVYCEAGHQDFAISIYSANLPVQDCLVANNRTFNSGASGIGVASTNFAGAYCRYNLITGNLIANPIQNAASIPSLGKGGINLYGVKTQGNTVQANTIIDEASNMLYGVNEWDDGTGAPQYNRMIDNNVPIAAGLIQQNHILTATSLVWDLDVNNYTPTVSSTTGTITSYIAQGAYKRRGKQVEFYFTISIINNGTGSVGLQVSTPLSTFSNGSLNGRENGVTGIQLNGYGGGSSNITIVNYNNAYPVSTGAIVTMAGLMQLA